MRWSSVLDKLIAPIDGDDVKWYDVARIILIPASLGMWSWASRLHWAWHAVIGWVCLVLLLLTFRVILGEPEEGVPRRVWLKWQVLVTVKIALVFALLTAAVDFLPNPIQTGLRVTLWSAFALFVLSCFLAAWRERRRMASSVGDSENS